MIIHRPQYLFIDIHIVLVTQFLNPLILAIFLIIDKEQALDISVRFGFLNHLTHDIYNAIDNLPGNASKVMHMYIVGHKYIEIAAHLQMPIGTVKTRISQARIILKEQLKDYLN